MIGCRWPNRVVKIKLLARTFGEFSLITETANHCQTWFIDDFFSIFYPRPFNMLTVSMATIILWPEQSLSAGFDAIKREDC